MVISKDKYINLIFNKKILKLLISFIVPVLIFIFKPLGMNYNQSAITAVLILVLIWWVTEIINRFYASLFLLIAFSILRYNELNLIFKFPISSNFYLIIFSFILSQGIINSNIANRLGDFILGKYGDNYYKLIIIAFILAVLLIFMIPQSFARVILIFAIYDEFLKKQKIEKHLIEIMLFLVAVATTTTIMFFPNGDIVLNYASMNFGGIDLNWFDWAKYMFVPTIFTSLITGFAFILIFKKELNKIIINSENISDSNNKLSNIEIKTIIIMSIVIILWMTEKYHSINGAIVAIVGVLAMLLFKIVKFRDFKSVNLDLMVFLTAAYSIGAVMKSSGVADIVFLRIMKLFPNNFSNIFLLVLIISVMVVHMLLGSALTTVSVVIPGMIIMTETMVDKIPVVLLIYIVTNIHYIFPFHQLTVMIGSGKNYFPNNIVFKFGLAFTPLVFFIIFVFYIPWWRFIGLL